MADEQGKIKIDMLGNSRIVDADGNVVSRLQHDEGIVYGEISIGAAKPKMAMRNDYWIAELPEFWAKRHESHRAIGAQLYKDVVKPARTRLKNQLPTGRR